MDQTKENKHDDYSPTVDYLAYSRLRDVNVIPETDYKALVAEVFQTITDQLRATYGPYGRQVMMNQGIDNITTKDGYNTFVGLNFRNPYKKMVYMNIKDICERVNRVVGDGTTSCVLLAEKMFNLVNAIIQTPDDMRNALKAFNMIEADYQNRDKIKRDKENGVISKLTLKSLTNLISVANNYDEELTDILIKALSPVVDAETGEVMSVRNIIVNKDVDPEAYSNVHYEFEHLPGQYRVAVEMNPDIAASLENWSHVKMIIYGHTFGENDWDKFYRNYDKEKWEEVIILAPAYTQKFLDACYAFAYAHDCKQHGGIANIKIGKVRGYRPQHEIADLCALLRATKIKPESPIIDHNTMLVEADIKVVHGNCMCFDNVTAPTTYIDELKDELDRSLDQSKISKDELESRIEALKLTSGGDTMLNIKGSTSLEVVMIADKVRDCISIVKSAMTFGIVSNMLKYGYNRTHDRGHEVDGPFTNCTNTKLQNVGYLIEEAIRQSIKGLYMDIWRSKYYATKDDEGEKMCEGFYDSDPELKSFDIIEEVYMDAEEFPTSAQYDLEVIVAAISIVKYQITSPVFIFDANLVPPQEAML